MKKGFYLYMYGRECFFETDAKNKTKNLALEFINKIQNKLNRFYNIDEDTIKYVQKAMQPAYCEIKTLSNGYQYYNIFGDNFGGYGGFVNEDDETIIV